MVKIAVISDTHGVLRPEVIEVLRTCQYIVHAGDFDSPGILDILKTFAPVYAVRGNNDCFWRKDLPETLRFSIGGTEIFLVHNRRQVPAALENTKIVIFGHSHQYFEETIDGRLWLNPGSCGRPRFGLELSMAILYMDQGSVRTEKIPLQP